MFTSDPAFRDIAISTSRRIGIRSRTDELMTKYSIEGFQVVWQQSASSYIPESQTLLEAHSARVKVPLGSAIFSDRGNVFFRNQEPLIPQIFRLKTACYPTVVHHFISPNDNHFHGSAKAKWRLIKAKNGRGKADSVE